MKAWFKDFVANLKADLKRLHRSLTIWFNGILTAASAAFLTIPMESVIAYAPQFQPYVEDALFRKAMVILIAINGINMALRFKTKSALRDK